MPCQTGIVGMLGDLRAPCRMPCGPARWIGSRRENRTCCHAACTATKDGPRLHCSPFLCSLRHIAEERLLLAAMHTDVG